MKERVLFVGRFPPPIHGASEANLAYFESKVIRERFDVCKVNLSFSDLPSGIGKISLKKIFGVFLSMMRLIWSSIFWRPNIVYFEIAPTGMAFIRDSLYVFALKLLRQKIVFQLHGRGIRDKTKNRLWGAYYAFVFKGAKIILLSRLIYDEVSRFMDRKNALISANGIKDVLAEEDFEKVLLDRKKEKAWNFLFLANMVREKGAIDVLKICSEMKKRQIDFKCFFVGPWQDKEFEKEWFSELEKYGLEDHCKYLGPKYGKEKFDLFKKAKGFIFPSTYKNESLPLVILEAFMFGVPVFSYDQGAIGEVVSKNFLGSVRKKGEWKALTSDLLKSLKGKDEAKKIRSHFIRNYDFNIAEKKLSDIFKNEIKKN